MLKQIQVPANFVELAGVWHDGQSPMLYAISSSGNLTRGTIRPLNIKNDDGWECHLVNMLESELYDNVRVVESSPDNFTEPEREEIIAFHDWAMDLEAELSALYNAKHPADLFEYEI